MTRLYYVNFGPTSITAANTDVDLVAVAPAAEKPLRLRLFRIGQLSEVADAQEENIRITIRRFTATVTNGTGGTAPTPVAQDDIDAAAGFTARIMDTTVATTTGTNEIKEEIIWNVRNNPLELVWPEGRETPIVRAAANRMIIRWETTVADTIDNVAGTTVWEEI